MNDLEQRIKALESKVQILEETLETLKNMSLTEQMGSYIKKKKQTLKMVDLLNAIADEPELDFSIEEKSVERISLAKKRIDSQIEVALMNSDSFSEQVSVDPRYFEYEEETGMITDYWGKPIQCREIQKYAKQGLRIISYNGFETERVVIPNEIEGRPVISIGEKVFMNASISEVVLPNSLKAILKQAFEGCENLSSISLPDELTYIGSDCFKRSGLEKFDCPRSISVIPSSCFHYCKRLSKVHLGTSVKKIEYFAFDDCENLSNIALPESLIEMEDACLANTAIKVIIIPQNVAKMHCESFSGNLWEISAKHKHKIVCVFLGKDTEIFTTVGKKSILSRVSLIYCLPGSKIQRIAREHSIPIKPISEFRMEDYQ
jgi:uncharacterized coiled-coil protein SlyX